MSDGDTAAIYPIRNILPKIIYSCNLILIIFILFFPREVLNAAREGLLLWFNNVLPALLPFIVAANILTALGFVRLIGILAQPFMKTVFKLPGAGGFALITGLISGYPMGAKTVADLWRTGEITTKEAGRLLAFCNNAGPLFIVGVVGVGLLGDSAAGYVLWAGHVATALIIGLLTRGWGRSGSFDKIQQRPYVVVPVENRPARTETANASTQFSVTGGSDLKRNDYIKGEHNIAKALGEAVKNAMEALLVVGGLIIFFSVVVKVITIITGDLPFIAEGIMAGVMEITGGVKILAETSGEVISPVRIGIIGGIIAFGGFSVHAQALHFTSGTGIKAGNYILFKALAGVIAAGVTWAIWSLYIR